MPKQIKDWYNNEKTNADKDTIETINRYYGVYDRYFSKFEHINFFTSQLYSGLNPFSYHSDAIGAGANQIMNCYRILGKTINETELLLLMKKLPNYNPPELKE